MPDSLIEVYKANLRDGDWSVRTYAAEALGGMGDKGAIPALIAALRDELAVVRCAAAAALAAIGDASAVPALIRALKDRNKDYVRPNVAVALARIGDSETLPRKILAVETLTPQGRIEVLDEVRRLHYRDKTITLRYEIPDVRALCRTIIDGHESAYEKDAHAMLDWLDGRDLLIPSRPVGISARRELLHPLKGAPTEAHPPTLLRAAGEVDKDEDS